MLTTAMLRARRAAAAVLAATAALGGAALGVAATPAAAEASARAAAPAASSSGGLLYFVSSSDVIESTPVGGGAIRAIVKVGPAGESVAGVALADGKLYWVLDSGTHNAIQDTVLAGTHHTVHTLVSGLPFPDALIAAGGWLFFEDEQGIGRVRPDGSHLTRILISIAADHASGLASDGTHLFYSDCLDHRISRASLSGTAKVTGFVALGHSACPQGLAVGGGHLYWAALPADGGSGHIGRVALSGHGVDSTWLSIQSSEGPFNLAADSAHVYWDWGGVAGSPFHVGRVDASGAGFRKSLLTGSGAFALTSPGAGG